MGEFERKVNVLTDLNYLIARLLKRFPPSAIRASDVHKTAKINAGCQLVSSTFGRHSYCGFNCRFLNAEVGSFCSISDDVVVGGSGHPIQFVSTSSVFLSHHDSAKTKLASHDYLNMPRTVIGSDVWMGVGAKVRSGVSIGHGAVVGMGSVVVTDVPPYAIVVGNPARVMRLRFSEDVVERLLNSRWWQLPDKELSTLGQYFDDPNLFLKFWEEQ